MKRHSQKEEETAIDEIKIAVTPLSLPSASFSDYYSHTVRLLPHPPHNAFHVFVLRKIASIQLLIVDTKSISSENRH